ncbi:fatty acid-binding protein-like [Arctopsyche grandis]|uniref:fatty acid-binding protein-like n=1 Tax=Arctopsyche grandis TaxID=121162 RepID=UPI00406DA347
MDAFLDKKYKLQKSENFDEFMKALGVGLVTRKMGNSISPVVDLKKEGDVYTFSSASTFKNTVITFKLGEEFDEETADGRKVKAVCSIEGNKLTQTQKGDGKTTTIIREFGDDELTATMTVDDITCTRIYKAQ